MKFLLITLTTDFGTASSYVAAMKGALLSVAADAAIHDLSHAIPPQDVQAAAIFLRDALPFFPRGCIHVVVVDPGVGSDRQLLLVQFQGSILLAPDNGCWTLAVENPDAVLRLSQRRYWRPEVAPTFHGRDILAPVAGHLALGVSPTQIGDVVNTWQKLKLPECQRGQSIIGLVMSVDHFGNLISNIPTSELQTADWSVRVADREIGSIHRTYSERPAGSLIAVVSSSGYLEVAVVAGSAATMLNAGIGSLIEVYPGLASAIPAGTTK